MDEVDCWLPPAGEPYEIGGKRRRELSPPVPAPRELTIKSAHIWLNDIKFDNCLDGEFVEPFLVKAKAQEHSLEQIAAYAKAVSEADATSEGEALLKMSKELMVQLQLHLKDLQHVDIWTKDLRTKLHNGRDSAQSLRDWRTQNKSIVESRVSKAWKSVTEAIHSTLEQKELCQQASRNTSILDKEIDIQRNQWLEPLRDVGLGRLLLCWVDHRQHYSKMKVVLDNCNAKMSTDLAPERRHELEYVEQALSEVDCEWKKFVELPPNIDTPLGEMSEVFRRFTDRMVEVKNCQQQVGYRLDEVRCILWLMADLPKELREIRKDLTTWQETTQSVTFVFHLNGTSMKNDELLSLEEDVVWYVTAAREFGRTMKNLEAFGKEQVTSYLSQGTWEKLKKMYEDLPELVDAVEGLWPATGLYDVFKGFKDAWEDFEEKAMLAELEGLQGLYSTVLDTMKNQGQAILRTQSAIKEVVRQSFIPSGALTIDWEEEEKKKKKKKKKKKDQKKELERVNQSLEKVVTVCKQLTDVLQEADKELHKTHLLAPQEQEQACAQRKRDVKTSWTELGERQDKAKEFRSTVMPTLKQSLSHKQRVTYTVEEAPELTGHLAELEKRYQLLIKEQPIAAFAGILSQLKRPVILVTKWLGWASPCADRVANGDGVDAPHLMKDIETARAQLPEYERLLAETLGALRTHQPQSREESAAVSAMDKELRATTDKMSEVAEKLMRDGKRINEKDLEELAILLGSIEDEYQRLMRWLADLTDVLTQPLPSGADIDFLAIEAALKSAKEIKKSLEVTNRPERLQFSGKCDDLIDRFSGSADGQDVAGKRDGVNDKWDEVIALCNRRIDDLRCMQTQLPPPVQVEGMPPPPPTSPDASAKKLLDWLNSFEIPRVAVGDTASCKMVAAYVKAVDRYMDAKSSNYLSATDEGDDNEAETIAALESKWSSTQEAAKNTSKVLPGVTEESEEFEHNYLPLFERLTNAHGLVTGTVQDGEKEYCQASVVDRQRQCKEVHECDWQLEILPVHQSGQLLAKKYDTTPSCSTPPIRLRLQQLAALLSTVESSSKSHLERLAEVVGLWAEVAEGDKELEPVLRRVDECAALAEPVPTTKAGVDAQLPEMKALLASVDEFQTLVDKFKVLYNELCKHYPPLDTQPLHRIIEHSIDAYNTRRAAVDTRLKELDLARMWHEKIFDRLKGILLWIVEQQKLLGICKKMATFSGVSLVVPDEQQPRPLESIKQQEQPVENAIQSADLYLKLGGQDDPVLTRPAGMDDKHLNLVDSEVAEANVTWPTLKHDARSWDDGLHRARRLFGDFKPTMDKFEEEMTAAGNELAQQPKVAERNKTKLQEQLKWHDMFEAQLADLLELGDLMDRQHQPLPADHVEFAEDLQKHYDDLHKQLDALKRASEQRGKALREALAQLPSGLDWVPGHLPGSWVRGENTKLVPFFFDTENCIAQWEHPVLHDWRLALSGYNYVRFASYRAALKLRELRRKTYMNTVPFQLVQEVISERGLEQQNDTYISVMSAGNTLSLMYKKLQDMGHDRIDNDESSDILLSFLFSVYDTNRCGEIRAMSLKLFLLVLCSGPVVEKIRWLSSQQTDGLGRLDRRTVANILYDANMITKFVFESGHFGNTIVDQAVEECFRQSPKSNRVIRPPDLAEWLTLQPRVLNWLWSLEKLTRSEQVDHEVTCVFCDRNIRGLRYRCKKHTSDNMCQDCFWEGRHNDQHKLYHLVQEYTSTASVSERVRDVTQSIKRKGRRSLHRAGAADVAKDFNVLQFVADADHVDRPMMLTEAFTELYPAASAPRRASSPARMRADSPSAAASPTKSAQTPSNKSSSDEAAMRANLDEDARHLQMLIDQRHKLTDSLPSISTVVPNSSRLQRLMGEQLKEEISVLEHHHSRALSTLDTSKAKGTGYRPGQRDSTMATPTSSTSESPHPEYPIFDMLDIFSTQVTDALTEKQPHTAVPMPNGYNDLCNGLQETSHGMSNIVRDCSTASSTNSSGGNMPLDNSRLSRYYVSECGSGKAINDPHRIQVSSDPPRKPWMSKFSFVAYPGHRPGTQRIYVLKSENPLRYRLSLHNQFGSWKDVFSFYAFGSPQPGRLPIFVSTRGSDENSTDPMCFLLSDSEGDRNSALASGWTASFTFYTPPESAVLSISSPPVNGHTNGGSAFSPFSPISPL